MERAIVFASAIVPALLLLGYGITKARASWRGEALWGAFVMGAVAALAALAGEIGLEHVLQLQRLPPILNATAMAIVIAAIPEEGVKFIVLVGLAERRSDVRRMQDIVVLALAVSMGFATLENLFYVTEPGNWQSVAMVRAMTAVPGHGIDGLAMGALATLARLYPERWLLLRGLALLVPIGVHTAYDFPLYALRAEPDLIWPLLLWPAVTALSAILAIRLCNAALRAAAAADHRSGSDRRPITAAATMTTCGWLLLVVSPFLVTTLVLFKDVQFQWGGAGLSILPAILGADLVRTGLRRRRLAAAWQAQALIRQP